VDPGDRQREAAAPQARLMATVINEFSAASFRGTVMIGVFLVAAVDCSGFGRFRLPWRVSLNRHTLAIFCGGAVRWFVVRHKTSGRR